MTNLEYLSEFLTENYGAICFRNCAEDGYISFDKDSNKSMETLSVYFANRLDLYNPTVKDRLEKRCGKNFYTRYKGTKDIKLSPVGGSVLATRYIAKGKTLTINCRMPTFNLGGGVWELIKYFIGRPIDTEMLSFPKLSVPVVTNTDFIVNENDNIKSAVEDYLIKHNKPLVNQDNGFYVQSLPLININDLFGEQISKANKIWEERGKAFRESLKFMSKSDWDDYKKAAGIYLQREKSEEFKKSTDFED